MAESVAGAGVPALTYAIFMREREEVQPAEMVLVIRATCEGNHGWVPKPVTEHEVIDEHPRAPIVRAGWLIGDDGVVLCPSCRAKR